MRSAVTAAKTALVAAPARLSRSSNSHDYIDTTTSERLPYHASYTRDDTRIDAAITTATLPVEIDYISR